MWRPLYEASIKACAASWRSFRPGPTLLRVAMAPSLGLRAAECLFTRCSSVRVKIPGFDTRNRAASITLSVDMPAINTSVDFKSVRAVFFTAVPKLNMLTNINTQNSESGRLLPRTRCFKTKIKPYSSWKLRFQRTATGKYARKQKGKRHKAFAKSPSQRMHLRATKLLHQTLQRSMKKLRFRLSWRQTVINCYNKIAPSIVFISAFRHNSVSGEGFRISKSCKALQSPFFKKVMWSVPLTILWFSSVLPRFQMHRR